MVPVPEEEENTHRPCRKCGERQRSSSSSSSSSDQPSGSGRGGRSPRTPQRPQPKASGAARTARAAGGVLAETFSSAAKKRGVNTVTQPSGAKGGKRVKLNVTAAENV